METRLSQDFGVWRTKSESWSHRRYYPERSLFANLRPGLYIARPPSFAKLLRTVHGQFGPFPTHGSLNSLVESTKFGPFRPRLAG